MNWITTSEPPPKMQRVEFSILLIALKELGLSLKKKDANETVKNKLRLVLGTFIKAQISI